MSTLLSDTVTRAAHADTRRTARGRAGLLLAVDVVALAIAFLVSVAGASLVPSGTTASPGVLLAAGAAGVLIVVALFAAYGLYDTDARHLVVTGFDETTRLFPALLLGALGLLLVDQVLRVATDLRILSAVQATIFVLCGLVLTVLLRGSLRSWVFPRIYARRRAIVLGTGDDARYLVAQLRTRREYGLDVVGFLADEPAGELLGAGQPPVVGRFDEVADMVEMHGIDRVILTSSVSDYEEVLEQIRVIRRPDVQISVLPRYFEVFAPHATLDDVAGTPLLNLPPLRLGAGARVVKRAFDLVVAAGLTVVLSPVLLAIAIAVRIDSPGPVFYRQERRGRGGSVFRIVKFRTMVDGADSVKPDLAHLNESDGPLFKIKSGRDPRVTRVGAVLRRWSLDELPQLFNVLRGEMSLVGPRPFVLDESDRITGWAARRLEMTPGVTGPWQALGRNDVPHDEMIKLDYLYATNWSLWWDLRIIYQTILAVLGRRGAY